MPRKTVAIRGLDTDLYHEVFTIAKKDGKRVAEVMNQAIEDFLNGGYKDGDVGYPNVFTLKNEGEITLSKRDIQSLTDEVGPFRIETWGRLIFEKDLDKRIMGCIERIVIHDGTIEVPKALYPQFLMKSEIYGKIEKY